MLLTAALGLSPYMALFGSMMLTEVFFTCFVLAALILARRPGNGAIVLAGLAVACAYLARTAGIALVISIPALLLVEAGMAAGGAVPGHFPARGGRVDLVDGGALAAFAGHDAAVLRRLHGIPDGELWAG